MRKKLNDSYERLLIRETVKNLKRSIFLLNKTKNLKKKQGD